MGQKTPSVPHLSGSLPPKFSPLLTDLHRTPGLFPAEESRVEVIELLKAKPFPSLERLLATPTALAVKEIFLLTVELGHLFLKVICLVVYELGPLDMTCGKFLRRAYIDHDGCVLAGEQRYGLLARNILHRLGARRRGSRLTGFLLGVRLTGKNQEASEGEKHEGRIFHTEMFAQSGALRNRILARNALPCRPSMTLEVSTPALLFPAISLLFLSYTNRFLHLSALVRSLHSTWKENRDRLLLAQIENLRRRLILIRWMQLLGAVSLFLCVVAMVTVIAGFDSIAMAPFAAALVLMAGSLACLTKEILMSGGALEIMLKAMEADQ